jgi:hypothetical protein
MVCFLPNEFMAPANQIVQEEVLPDMDEAEQIWNDGIVNVGQASYF